MDEAKVMGPKVSFDSRFRVFWDIFIPTKPLGVVIIIYENLRMLHFLPYKVVTQCKISENTMDSH